MDSPSLSAEIKEIEEQYSYQGDVFEQSVRVKPLGLTEISCFDKKALVEASDVGETLKLGIELTHFEDPEPTEREPGFYRPEDPSNSWKYEVVGDIVKIDDVQLTFGKGEKIILKIREHTVGVKTRPEFENVKEDQRILLSNNRVDLELLSDKK